MQKAINSSDKLFKSSFDVCCYLKLSLNIAALSITHTVVVVVIIIIIMSTCYCICTQSSCHRTVSNGFSCNWAALQFLPFKCLRFVLQQVTIHSTTVGIKAVCCCYWGTSCEGFSPSSSPQIIRQSLNIAIIIIIIIIIIITIIIHKTNYCPTVLGQQRINSST